MCLTLDGDRARVVALHRRFCVLKWFRPEYRIILNRHKSYEAQSRSWWWPSWTYVTGTLSSSLEETEERLNFYLEFKRGRVQEILYLGRL